MQKINVQTGDRTNTIWLSNVNLSRVNHYTIPAITFSERCGLCLEIFPLKVHKFGNKICHPFLLRKCHSGGELWQLLARLPNMLPPVLLLLLFPANPLLFCLQATHMSRLLARLAFLHMTLFPWSRSHLTRPFARMSCVGNFPDAW